MSTGASYLPPSTAPTTFLTSEQSIRQSCLEFYLKHKQSYEDNRGAAEIAHEVSILANFVISGNLP